MSKVVVPHPVGFCDYCLCSNTICRMCRVCFFCYNPPYYEPRDLERYEVVKEGEKKTLEKSLEEVGQERTQKYIKYKDVVKTEEQLE